MSRKKTVPNKTTRVVLPHKGAQYKGRDSRKLPPWFIPVVIGLTYAAGLGMRLWELPVWNQDGFHFQGQRIMATNDAYYYLAATAGTSFQTAYSEFVTISRGVFDLTGLEPARAAFWLPAFVAPLVILPVAAAAWREGLPESLLPAGIVAGCGGEFLVRTRLGFYDHDMLSLFLPLCFAVGLLMALSLHAQRSWRFWRPGEHEELALGDVIRFFLGCLGLGAMGWGYLAFYPSGLYLVLSLWATALCLALVFATDRDRRVMLGLGITTVLPLALEPAWGLALFAVMVGMFFCCKRWLVLPVVFWSVAGLVLAAGLFFVDIPATWNWMHSKLAYQLNPDTLAPVGRLILPTFLHSVSEVQTIPWTTLGFHMVGSSWVFLSGFTGYVLACLMRPRLLIFLPFLIAGAAGLVMGVRFTMYGGVVIGLGLGFGAAMLLRRIGFGPVFRAAALGMLSLALLWPLTSFRSQLQVRPYVTPKFVQAMNELRELAAPGARVWGWWDMGFPTQFYAGLATLADGQRQENYLLYPLGVVHMTTSPLQAAQVMKMATSNQAAFVEPAVTRSGDSEDVASSWRPYLNNPIEPFQNLDPAEAQAEMEGLARVARTWPDNLREQYLALHWDTIDASYFITLFGTWNVAEQSGLKPEVKLRFTASDPVDLNQGTISLIGRILRMDSWLDVGADGQRSMQWDNNSGLHGVFNRDAGTGYLMDDRLYRSMMVQMLIAAPILFDRHFELMIDKGPAIRVFRVR